VTNEEGLGFRRFLYLVQIQQAKIYETAASRWRRGKSDPSAATAGLLYWQLNDVWAGPSWSGIDGDGRWKPLHYSAKRFFNPVAVFGVIVDGKGNDVHILNGETFRIEVHMVNDLPIDVEGALSAYQVPFEANSKDEVVLLVEALSVRVAASSAAVVWRTTPDALKHLTSNFATSSFLEFVFTPTASRIATPSSSSSRRRRSDTGGSPSVNLASSSRYSEDRWESLVLPVLRSDLLLVEPKDAWLGRPRVSIDNVVAMQSLKFPGHSVVETNKSADAYLPCSDYAVKVTLRAEGGVAMFVYLETSLPMGTFSDNLFSIFPWETKTIYYCPKPVVVTNGTAGIVADLDAFKDSMHVEWLQRML